MSDNNVVMFHSSSKDPDEKSDEINDVDLENPLVPENIGIKNDNKKIHNPAKENVNKIEANDEVFLEPTEEMQSQFDKNKLYEVPLSVEKNWTRAVAERLSEYANDSRESGWKHGKDAKYYNDLNTYVTIFSSISATITIVLSGIIIRFVGSDFSPENFYVILGCIIGIQFFTGIFNGYKHVKNFVGRIIVHSESSSKFGRLFRKIKDEFALPLNCRQDGQSLLREIGERYTEVHRDQPLVRDNLDRRWARKENSEIKLPAEFRD